MKLLFVEDDDVKRARVTEHLAINSKDIEMLAAKSFDSALRCLVGGVESIDAILLDMSMPNFDDSEEPPESFAGRDLLFQLKLRKQTRPTIVITQFDSFGVEPDKLSLQQLDAQLRKEFAPAYVGLVHYSSAHESWKLRLSELLLEIGGKKR